MNRVNLKVCVKCTHTLRLAQVSHQLKSAYIAMHDMAQTINGSTKMLGPDFE